MLMDRINEGTVRFQLDSEGIKETKRVLNEVCRALKEKGYDPVDQLVGYFISGDPAYITNHRDARTLIKRLDKDELLEEMVRFYLRGIGVFHP
jgi:uncharacterized protein (UPF0297 family)